MNKKLGFFLKSNSRLYLFALLGFSIIAGIFGQYLLAIIELLITAVLFFVHLL